MAQIESLSLGTAVAVGLAADESARAFGPLLQAHAEADEIIIVDLGKELFEAA